MLIATTALLALLNGQLLTPIVVLDGEVEDKTTAPLVAFMANAAAYHIPTVVLFIDSPGGEDAAGFALVDSMRAAQKAGVEIVCMAEHAASMAAVIFEACSVRKMHVGGQIMFHESAYGMLIGTPGARLTKTALAAFILELARDDEREASIVAPRVHMTIKQYMDWTAGQDRYLGAAEALSRGFIDGIVVP